MKLTPPGALLQKSGRRPLGLWRGRRVRGERVGDNLGDVPDLQFFQALLIGGVVQHGEAERAGSGHGRRVALGDTASSPAMTDIEANLALARKVGFEVVDHFTLAAEGWAAYIDPVERRMNEVLAKHPGDPDAEKAAEAERREIAMFRKNRGWFGYEFFLLKRK